MVFPHILHQTERKYKQMASVRQKNKRWYYYFNVRQADGTYKRIERGGFKSKRQAQEEGNKLEQECKGGNTSIIEKPKNITFSSLIDEWEKDAPNLLRYTTIQGYRKYIKTHLMPVLGDRYLTSITTELCQSIIDDCITVRHNRLRSVQSVYIVMRSLFNYAVSKKYVDNKNNPLNDIVLPKERSVTAQRIKPPRPVYCLPQEELKAIFDRFKGTKHYLPLLLGYRCGLRKGETYGLTVEDVDLDNATLRINKQIQLKEDERIYYFTPPKYCKQGEGRVIHIDKDTLSILKEYLSHYHIKDYYVNADSVLNTDGDGKKINLLLVDNEGNYVDSEKFHYVTDVIHGRKGHIDYVDKDFHYHLLRHTHASLLVAKGVPPTEIAKRLGHKNLETTYRTYIHSSDISENKANDIIDDMYN